MNLEGDSFLSGITGPQPKKSAPIKFFANTLANSRDNSYGGGLVVLPYR